MVGNGGRAVRITWSFPIRGERLSSHRGDAVRARRLIEALRSQGHDVQIVEDAALARSRVTVQAYRGLFRRLLPLRLALLLRDSGRWLHARAQGRRVAAQARAQQAAVLIETQASFASSGALAARLTGLPLILDDCSPSCEDRVLGGIGLSGLARRVLRQQARASVRVVAVTRQGLQRLVAEGLPSEKLKIVPNGVGLARYRDIDRPALRRRLGLHEALVIGYVGSFKAWHRLDLLVDAFARLQICQARLLLVGDGSERQKVEAACRRLGVEDRVQLHGAADPDQVPGLLTAMDIAVLPGTNDYGHPMKLVEYAAAGCVVVAPDVPTVSDVVEDGVNGMLFPDGDGSALTAVLTRLAQDEDLRTRLGSTARTRVGEQSTWESCARTLLEGLDRDAAGGGTPAS